MNIRRDAVGGVEVEGGIIAALGVMRIVIKFPGW